MRRRTKSRKILIAAPTILALLCLNATNYQGAYLWVNVAAYLLSIIPKMPAMHGVRIFGINSTVGINDSISPVQNQDKAKAQ